MKDEKMDPKLKDALDGLQTVLPRDPASARRGKIAFLRQAEAIRTVRSGKTAWKGLGWLSIPPGPARRLANAVFAVVLAGVLFFGAGAGTVYAAQDSLPDEGLYAVKTWSEDTLLSLTGSPETQLNYVLDFTDRRIDEVGDLVVAGNAVPENVVIRLQDQLEQVLELAVGLDDEQMAQGLEEIRVRAEAQLQTLALLMLSAPESDQPVLVQAHLRIREQVQLCALGENDPGGFRLQVRRRQYQGGLEGQPSTPSGEGYQGGEQTPAGDHTPAGGGNGPGPGRNQPSGTPEAHGPGAGQTSQPGGAGQTP